MKPEECKIAFLRYLKEEERSTATLQKYEHDIRRFLEFVQNAGVEKTEEFPASLKKDLVLRYKEMLQKEYAVSSANSMLVAMNRYLTYIGRADVCVKLFRTQRQIFRDETTELTRAEYLRLLRAAKRSDERLFLLMETIGSTGIRVSEHRFITVESLKSGYAEISNKGKSRMVYLEEKLCKELLRYCRKNAITSGPVFVSRRGNPLNRSYIWRLMKKLAEEANVSPGKIFPHNLRHLFAVTFYRETRDIVHLADLLGHANMNTTRIYTSISITDHRNRLKRMNMLLQ